MKKLSKILSGTLALTLLTSAFTGFSVSASEPTTMTKQVVTYENNFNAVGDDTRNITFTDRTGNNSATVVMQDGWLVQKNATGMAFQGSYQIGQGQVVVDFAPQDSGIVVVELTRTHSSNLSRDNFNTQCYDGIMTVNSSDGTRVAGVAANGRGADYSNAWNNGAWTSELNNNNWIDGCTIKFVIDLDNNTYKVYQGSKQLSMIIGGGSEFRFGSSLDIAQIRYNYTQNEEMISGIKVYKEMGATQNFTEYTVLEGDTTNKNLVTIGAFTLAGMSLADFNYQSSNDAVVRVRNGAFQARGLGTAVITLSHKLYSDIVFNLTVNVSPASTGIAITGDMHNMYIGQSKQLQYSLTPEGTTVRGVTWSSDNPTVANVDANGVVTAGTTAGTAVITVSGALTSGALTDTCMINVGVPQDGLAILGGTEVMVGGKLQLTAGPKVVDFTLGTVTWSLDSNPSGTVIDASTGEVTAGSVAGPAVARASCFGGLVTATHAFDVIAPANGLRIRDNQGVYELDKDANNPLELDVVVLGGFTPDAITWSASPSSAITLTQSGNKAIIDANAIETTGVTVTVSCYGGAVSDSCIIKVHRGVGTISVTGSQAVLDIGDRATLTGAWANADTTINTATALNWRSSNHYVATVNGNGQNAVVTAVGSGTAQIYYMGAGQQGSFTVTVNPKTDAYGNIVEDKRSPSVLSFAEVKGSFSDIADMRWAQTAIQNVYAKGIMTPDSDNFFGAKRNIKRDEFVSVVIKTLGLEGEVSEEAKKFDDVDESNPYYAEIMKAVELGIIKGINDTSFAPNDDITRQDLSVVVYNALEAADISTVEGRLDFNDKDSISEYALKPVRVLSRMSIMIGKDGGMFDPRANTTRAEAAIISEKIEAIR